MAWAPPIIENTFAEQRRLAAVAATHLVDTLPEKEFDDLVELAAEICGTALGAFTLLDETQQFVKASYGDVQTIPRNRAFCNYTIRQDGVFTVDDTTRDERFREHPMVVSAPCLRFYAAVPLRTADGYAVGALCVIDTVPHELTAQQKRALELVGAQISARIQLRMRIAEADRLAEDLEGERELFYEFLNAMPIEAYLKDDQSALVFYNQRAAERFGVSQTAWVGRQPKELWPASRAEMVIAEDQYVLRTNEPQESYLETTAADGQPGYWKIIRAPLHRRNGERLLANIALDLTAELRREAEMQKLQDALEEANRKLRSLSLTDDLTGLWNRRSFDARLETEILRVTKSKEPLALLMIDVDDFKKTNDTYGHSYGDEVLRALAEVLRRAVRVEDVANRFGGEEFTIILPNTGIDGAKATCRRIAQALERRRWLHDRVTVSVGIAIWAAGTTSDDLLNMADEAMYRAKRSGKNCAVAYEVEAEPPAEALASV